jgi:hypothetical protein
VQDARRRLWQPLPSFPDLASLNAWLEARCIAAWSEIPHGVMPGTIADVHAAEIASLMEPGRPFDGFVEHTKRVSPTCLIHFERNRYSVPASFANRPVSLRVYPERIVIAAEGRTVCEHARLIDRSHHLPGRTIHDWRHYLAALPGGDPAKAWRQAVKLAQTATICLRAMARPSPRCRMRSGVAGPAAQARRRRSGDGRHPRPGAAPRRAGGAVRRRDGA